jgi:hypothetical protein
MQLRGKARPIAARVRKALHDIEAAGRRCSQATAGLQTRTQFTKSREDAYVQRPQHVKFPHFAHALRAAFNYLARFDAQPTQRPTHSK